MARTSVTRWVREVSQRELLTNAKARMAHKYGLRARRPEGAAVFWQKVYSPVYYRLPIAVRNRVVAAMPGSHRRTWHQPPQASGPAASLLRAGVASGGDGRKGA